MVSMSLVSLPTSKLSPVSSTKLIEPLPSIQDDIELQRLIVESEKICVELEKYLPITCVQAPFGEFVDPREIYLQVALKQTESQELIVDDNALKLLEKYIENVMARVVRLSEYVQEEKICTEGCFQKTFTSRESKGKVEISFTPSEHFKGYSLRINTNSEESSNLMFNIAFMKYPEAETNFSQGLFIGTEQVAMRGNSDYISLQSDRGSIFLDSQLRGLLNSRRKFVAGKNPMLRIPVKPLNLAHEQAIIFDK